MRKFFKGINEKATDGWMLATVTGTSCIDDKYWVIDTNSIARRPRYQNIVMMLKKFAQFVAGLLNCYFNNIDAKDFDETYIASLGVVDKEQEIPSAKNPELPF